MSDTELASVIAAELHDHLRGRAADLSSPVYAVSLWSFGDYGELGVSIGTEEDAAEGRPAPPASRRWRSGEWQFVAEPFVTPSSQQRLKEFEESIDNAAGRYLENPDPLKNSDSFAEMAAAIRRWQMLTNQVMSEIRPLTLVDSTPDAVAFVEFENFDASPVHIAMSMTLATDGEILRRAFPHWRRLCDELTSLDAETLVRVREMDADRAGHDSILPPETERLLAECGFTWRNLARWDGAHVPSDFDPGVPNAGTNEPIALAFVVADRIG